ncbi:PREDICTED: probable ATP-dependent RNA helicase DDX10 [Nicrophorus vespilloides]|uniref:ATP-dependent RNA helicase n=1 Tax=Nicrophorus vespilloides TaxID=110193 RepID=A0ABM1NII2_NICVS|nr:PREDICTED: probable ATP-dependent RNA helicase DDX10 [Nicrophorus vespilloides]
MAESKEEVSLGKKKQTKGKPNKKPKFNNNKNNRKKDGDDEVTALQEQYEQIDISTVKSFAHLPISKLTLRGLKESKYTVPTDIQRNTIKLALNGKDILGASQTGSGKTLAFLVPLLEILYCNKWSRFEGVGAIIITPTRELAYQIFETLRNIGQYHDFSAGLIIGGQNLRFERGRMDQVNIIVCTPGRLLQHMDENPLFDCTQMKVLVLDEADKCLDMGFADTMNAIVANLPEDRQTMLFSATQTKDVKHLARLSLKDPSYVSVHEHVTPKDLKQSYVVCELHDKMAMLWSFIKNHLKQKVIIFMSSCKQVKYTFEIFSKLRPGVSLMALYGTLHQQRRMDIYNSFCTKQFAILFATDIASRGLDFPSVNWVVQMDCPEDTETYIHRVGRTARFKSGGESLLLLMPSELAMVDALENKKIPIEKIDINADFIKDPVRRMQSFLAMDPELKDTAQRAFKSYAKAVNFMKNKDVFKIQELDTDKYAYSLGLANPPRIRFLQRMNKQSNAGASVNNNRTVFDSNDESDDELPSKAPGNPLFSVADDDDDIITLKRKDHDVELGEGEVLEVIGRQSSKKAISKAKAVKKLINKKIVANSKITFDDDGEAMTDNVRNKKRSEVALEYEKKQVSGIDIEEAKEMLREEDRFDKQVFREKVKAKHKEEKKKLKEQRKKDKEDEDEGEKDDFGSDEESEYEPDLSWLPDPDKVYGQKDDGDSDEFYEGKRGDDDDDNDDDHEEEVEEEKPQKKSKKRKLLEPDSKPKKKKNKLADIGANLDVNEAEELAMMLLSK